MGKRRVPFRGKGERLGNEGTPFPYDVEVGFGLPSRFRPERAHLLRAHLRGVPQGQVLRHRAPRSVLSEFEGKKKRNGQEICGSAQLGIEAYELLTANHGLNRQSTDRAKTKHPAKNFGCFIQPRTVRLGATRVLGG